MDKRIARIVEWLKDYADQAGKDSLVVGVSGGVDSALTSTLCCMTGKVVFAVTMPLRSKPQDRGLALDHLDWLENRFPDDLCQMVIPLDEPFKELKGAVAFMKETQSSPHADANTKSRLRMTCLYHLAACIDGLVVGTGNKVEDFGVGFFTKWGDGGVDLSPIGDLMKSEVRELAAELEIPEEIITQAPTDGLWEDGRTDEDQLQISYEEIERCMRGEEVSKGVQGRFKILQDASRHKMEPIPVCRMDDGWEF